MTPGTSLSTTLGSLHLENPFLLSSGPPTASAEMIKRAFRAGWAGAVIKTIRPARYELDDLLSQVREDNLHDEIETGKPVGREAW